MTSANPSIQLSQNFGIGYTSTLAATDAQIELGVGTHYLLARNGRGKTTMLRTIAGTLKKKSGTHTTQGFVQFIPENMTFDAEMPSAAIFHALIAKSRRSQAIALAEEVELDLAKPYAKLSTGNRRKVSLITAEFSTRDNTGNVLLLDEPFSGLDAHARAIFERHWRATPDVLRLVSCHPDYDGMPMSSAVMIDHHIISYHTGPSQTWNDLKPILS